MSLLLGLSRLVQAEDGQDGPVLTRMHGFHSQHTTKSPHGYTVTGGTVNEVVPNVQCVRITPILVPTSSR
jgi:hypothetical protein